MDAKAVSRITIVCHLFSAMSILLHFELDSDPGRRGEGCCVCSGGRGGGGTIDMVIYEIIENTIT